jgi:hypothetical protein
VPDTPTHLPTKADIERLEKAIERLTDEVRTKLDVQFKRMVQLQADIDLVRAAWVKVEPKDS